MSVEFKCPQCGNAVSVDESYRGQVVECPHCAKGIVVPKSKADGGGQRQAPKVIRIQCPHCGTEYVASQQDMNRLVSCEICGKDFVANATNRRQGADSPEVKSASQTTSPRKATLQQNQMPRSRPFIAIGNVTPEPCTRKPKLAIWITAGAACIAVMLTLAFIFGRHSGMSDSPAKAVAIAEGNDGGKQKENKNDSAIPTNNGTIGKVPEEPTVGTNADTISRPEQEEVTAVTNESETPIKPSLEMCGDMSPKVESIALLDGPKLKGKNPLELFHFGDAPREKLSENNTVKYEMSDFIGIQKMILGYTTKGHLYSIGLVSENDHCSASESDARVSKLMQLCDEWCDGIKWNVGVQEHDGRKFAIGQIKTTCFSTSDSYQAKDGEHVEKKWCPSHRRGAGPNEGFWEVIVYNYRDMLFSIVPTRGKNNVVGLQVNLIDNRLKRLENDYNEIDVRHLCKVTDSQYHAAKVWLRDQLEEHILREYSFRREYNETSGLYNYLLCLHWGAEKYIETTHSIEHYVKEITIILDNGVLRTSCSINAKSLPVPLADDYAEKIITARILIANKELEGIAGAFYDSDGYRGGYITLPCPICKGNKSKQRGVCKCWTPSLKRNMGSINIAKRDFEEEFKIYKSEYKTGIWSPPVQPQKKKESSDYVPLNQPYKPTKAEQKDIDDADRESRRLNRLRKRR